MHFEVEVVAAQRWQLVVAVLVGVWPVVVVMQVWQQ